MARNPSSKKPNPHEEAYELQIRRIYRARNKLIKQGYKFEGSVIPKRPKRITQATVNKLKKITPSTLKKKAVTLPETVDKNRTRSTKLKGKKTRAYRDDSPLKKQTNPYDKEWAKEAKSLRGIKKRAENRGWIFEEDLIPKRPANPTKADIDELKRLKKELYDHGALVINEDGEVLTGQEGLKKERSDRAKKAAKTRNNNKKRKIKKIDDIPFEADIILDNIDAIFRDFYDTGGAGFRSEYLNTKANSRANRAQLLLQNAINKFGKTIVATKIKENMEQVEYLINKLLYDSKPSEAEGALTEFSIILFGSLSLNEYEELEEADDY